jgi:UDP-2,3-diacylglucosamine pyrophosphatase LpxH
MDTYVVSDLHLSEGWLAAEQRFSRLENFFYDLEFRNFTRAILAESKTRGRTARLIFNGDVFDFLAIVRTPKDPTELAITRTEREFGLNTTEAHAVWKMERIAAGHKRFFHGLAELLHAGHHLAFVRGNHDMEMFWPAVQSRVVDAIADVGAAHGLSHDRGELAKRVTFHQWFVYEPGRFWVEHGNQYERSNSVHFVLNPVLPPEYHRAGEAQLDYPIGSIFVRYVYNKMRLLDPYTSHFVTVDQYLSITYHHNFFDLLRTATLHFPFFTRAIQEARVFEQLGMAPVQAEHERRIEQLARDSGVSADTLAQLLKLQSRAVGTTKYNLLRQLLKPVVRGGLSALFVGLLSLITWFYLFSWIQTSELLGQWILGKASLLAVFAVATVFGLFFGFSFLNRRLHRASEEPEPYEKDVAEAIAEAVDVPFVSMGHTHSADFRPLVKRPGAFANSGTWIVHSGPWDTIRARARQFTFVMFQDDEMKVRRWNDSARKWEPVGLLEDHEPTGFERLLALDERQNDPRGRREDGQHGG